MLDNDKLTYSPNKRKTAFGDSDQSHRLLLSPDRAQKFDLLIHLITNLQQSLIICGPEGIGKSTLIKALQDSHNDIWPICRVQGSSALSFESVITQLSQFLNLSSATIRFDLSSLRAFCEKQKVVLAIDDAGELVPGLIGELIDFSDSLPGLRLVFAMDSEHLPDKTESDHAVEACHFIELPPLNQRQCFEYLQNLSVQPGSALSFNAINDALAEELYRKTDGIPGKLLAQLPKLSQYQSRQNLRLGVWGSLAVIVIASVFAIRSFLPADTDEAATARIDEPAQTETEAMPSVSETAAPPPTIESSEEASPAPSTTDEPSPIEPPLLTTEPPEAAGGEPENDLSAPLDATTPAPDLVSVLAPESKEPQVPALTAAPEIPAQEPPPAPKKPAPTETLTPKQTELASPPKPSLAAPSKTKTESDTGDLEWIQAQPASNYTVQLMVLSYKNSVDRFMKKHAEYRDELKYYTIGKSGQEKYVLIYGSFQSATDALNSKSTMPDEFNKGIVKRFKLIQRESRRHN